MLNQHPDQLAVLMCKSKACRPCKMFLRKYMRLAERFPEVLMLDIYGDESPGTRKSMMEWQVKVTPTFRMYRGTDLVDISTGINEKKLGRALLAHLFPAELAQHEADIKDFMEVEEVQPVAAQELQPVAAQS